MYPYIKIFEINIPTYGLCICAAIFLCAVLSFAEAHRRNVDCNDLLIIFAASVGIGMFCGGLLYIFVTYDLKKIFEMIMSGNFEFFKKQGIVFYGGLIGGVFAAVVSAKILNFKIKELEICTVPYIPLGHAIGRIGCLLAGCCYGLPYDGIFAAYTKINMEYGSYFPIQVIEAIFNLLIMVILLLYRKKDNIKYSITCLYMIMYSCLRFVLEFFRGDVARGSFFIFSTSQWISIIILIISSSFLFYKTLKRTEC